MEGKIIKYNGCLGQFEYDSDLWEVKRLLEEKGMYDKDLTCGGKYTEYLHYKGPAVDGEIVGTVPRMHAYILTFANVCDLVSVPRLQTERHDHEILYPFLSCSRINDFTNVLDWVNAGIDSEEYSVAVFEGAMAKWSKNELNKELGDKSSPFERDYMMAEAWVRDVSYETVLNESKHNKCPAMSGDPDLNKVFSLNEIVKYNGNEYKDYIKKMWKKVRVASGRLVMPAGQVVVAVNTSKPLKEINIVDEAKVLLHNKIEHMIDWTVKVSNDLLFLSSSAGFLFVHSTYKNGSEEVSVEKTKMPTQEELDCMDKEVDRSMVELEESLSEPNIERVSVRDTESLCTVCGKPLTPAGSCPDFSCKYND